MILVMVDTEPVGISFHLDTDEVICKADVRWIMQRILPESFNIPARELPPGISGCTVYLTPRSIENHHIDVITGEDL